MGFLREVILVRLGIRNWEAMRAEDIAKILLMIEILHDFVYQILRILGHAGLSAIKSHSQVFLVWLQQAMTCNLVLIH